MNTNILLEIPAGDTCNKCIFKFQLKNSNKYNCIKYNFTKLKKKSTRHPATFPDIIKCKKCLDSIKD